MLFRKPKRRKIHATNFKDALNISATAADQIDQFLSTLISIVDKCRVISSTIGTIGVKSKQRIKGGNLDE